MEATNLGFTWTFCVFCCVLPAAHGAGMLSLKLSESKSNLEQIISRVHPPPYLIPHARPLVISKGIHLAGLNPGATEASKMVSCEASASSVFNLASNASMLIVAAFAMCKKQLSISAATLFDWHWRTGKIPKSQGRRTSRVTGLT